MRSHPCCFLCGKPFQYLTKYGVRTWKAHCQHLALEEDSRHVNSLRRLWYGAENVTHSLCWDAVTKAVGTEVTDHEWLERFRQLLLQIGPFLTPISFPDEPLVPDSILYTVPKPAERIQTSNTVLPYEIIQLIYRYFDSYLDITHFTWVVGIEPGRDIWLNLGRKYLAYGSPFFEGSVDEVAVKLRRLIHNLQSHPDDLPNIQNYTVIWDNIEILLSKAKQRLLGAEDCSTSEYQVHYVSTPRILFEKEIRLSDTLMVSLRFNHVLDRSYLCGLQFNDEFFGYEGEFAINIDLKQLCGLQLASDKEGIVALKVKDGLIWESHWYGSDRNSCRLEYTKIEWPLGTSTKFHIAFDAFKIHALSHIHGEAQCNPLSWISGLPPDGLVPDILVKCQPTGNTLPVSYVDKPLKAANVVSAFVSTETQAISGFEFLLENNKITIGKPEGSKLSIEAQSQLGELFTGLACTEGRKESSVAVKVSNFLPSISMAYY
ncbi:hypothetical protein MGYG_06119 [Nannizzia gypsea CBS 118893]|uniref:DUF7600 domain-containing protein n=1 Tax=Arthroderma gypseum (strain ATCC MYA-4604 / CBS 118893) TaxID=535722 RepID=E4V0I7_ARTGP|nr:hypothetical protein MGYG_06119 [Nannizzia gypsea CBS 118893]EFR03124.1 hypothetical protein MGYG_06119 [Nannizzia gypsea CBS 118893]